MDLVIRELNRMEQIVWKLLFFSKDRKLVLKPVNIHELLFSALQTLEEEIAGRRVRVTTKLEAEHSVVHIDASEMREVFLNIFMNALEAMPKGGRLTIATSNGTNGSGMIVTVTDTGKGVDHRSASKIFDPFFTTKDAGTGLGLSIAYEIVRVHRGTLETDPSVKRGARFVVTLPAHGIGMPRVTL